MLASGIDGEVSAIELANTPRLFNFTTGVYADFTCQMVGALVVDMKLCCCLLGAFEGLEEEAAQDLLLTQELTSAHGDVLRGLFEVLSCMFFLEDGSDRLRCTLHEVVDSVDGLTTEVKRFMAAPPRHSCFQIAVSGYGEGTLVYIAVDAVELESGRDE